MKDREAFVQHIQYLQIPISQQLFDLLDKVSVKSEQVAKSLVLVHIQYLFQLSVNT